MSDATSALRYLSAAPGYDVALVDVQLPDKSAFALLEKAGDLPIDTSFLLLGPNNLDDKRTAFRMGADDYAVQPCAVEELEARVESILRRRLVPAKAKDTQTFVLDDLTLNFASKTCFREGRRIPLTSLEFKILQHLVEHRGRVVPREELRDSVWMDRDSICLRTIDRHVAKIREKVEENPDMPAYLQTVYGKGYEFTRGQTTEATTSPTELTG